MAGSYRQPPEGKEELGEDVANFLWGGGGSEGVRSLLQAVVQAVLMFGEEMWVRTPRMEWALSSFQHRVL